MINFKAPDIRELKPRILVLGIGGAGGNAIDGMIDAGLQGVEFIAVNTDAQDLKLNKAKTKIQRVEKIEKSIKPENDSNKRKHQRVPSFSSILIDALK